MLSSYRVTHSRGLLHRLPLSPAPVIRLPHRATTGKRRYNIKLWKTFTDCFNCLPIAAIIDEKIFTMHGGLSPDLQSMEQIRRVMRPTDVPDTGASWSHSCWVFYGLTSDAGLLCDLLWSDPDKDITGWSENDRGVSFTFGPDVVSRFLQKHDMDLICRAHQVRVLTSISPRLVAEFGMADREYSAYAPFRSWRTGTNSLPSDTWSPCSLLPTIAESSTTLVR